MSNAVKRELATARMSQRQAVCEIGISHATLSRVVRGLECNGYVLFVVRSWLAWRGWDEVRLLAVSPKERKR